MFTLSGLLERLKLVCFLLFSAFLPHAKKEVSIDSWWNGGAIQFCGHSNKILVLNLCPLGSFSIQAQDGDGESRISKDGLILDINTFARCLENVDLFSGLLFVCSCVRISVFLSFYRKAPWGREDLLFGLEQKIGIKLSRDGFCVAVAISVTDRTVSFVPMRKTVRKGGVEVKL